MRNKILLISVLAVLLFVASCAPKLSDEEQLAQLDQMSDEELEAATAEGSGALAGQATRVKLKLPPAKCSDTDTDKDPAAPNFVPPSKNPYQQGKYVWTFGSKNGEGVDQCAPEGSELLRERYCLKNGYHREVTIECDKVGPKDFPEKAGEVWKCLEGACVSAPPRCGDSVIAPPEECDDGDTDNTDACTNDCRRNRCGDGFLFIGAEQCDDGNTASGDGCSAACVLEGATTPGQGPVAGPVCGNGNKEGTEECDDGNTANDDSCTNTCNLTGGMAALVLVSADATGFDAVLNLTTVTAEIMNDGFASTGTGFAVRFQQLTVLGQPQTDTLAPALAVGESTTVTVTLKGYCPSPMYGHSVSVFADPNNEVVETSKADNGGSATYTC